MTGLLYAKPRPKLLDKRQKASQIGEIDRRQRSLCHQRSGMKCEVFTELGRCGRRVSENHHLIGGIGRRNRGKSLLAAHRLDCCDRCHSDITGHVLVPVGTPEERESAALVRFERRR